MLMWAAILIWRHALSSGSRRHSRLSVLSRCFLWSFLVVRNCRKFWVTHFSLKKLHSFSWSWGTFWRSAWFFFFHPWFTFSSCTWSDTNTLKILPRISTLLGFLQCFISLWSCCCNRKDSSVTRPRTLIHNLLTLYSSREHTQLHLVLFVFMLLRLYYCCNDSQSFYPGPRRRGTGAILNSRPLREFYYAAWKVTKVFRHSFCILEYDIK